MKNLKIFACPSAEEFTEEICDCLKLKMGKMKTIKFKNDNTFVQIEENVREQDIYIVQTTMPPVNERVMELLIAIDAFKRASARRINVILPYYIYSRSDKKDQPRIPVTAKLMAQLIEAAGATRVITCDLHNPAIQAYFNINCDRISAQNLLQNYFKEEYFKCPIALIDKRRNGNDDKAVATHVIGEVAGKEAIIFDDEVDTAGSLIETARILEENHAKEIYAGCTHAVLSANASERIKQSPIKELVVTNTIPVTKEKMNEKIKVVSIAPLFAEAIKRINEARPIGDLFKLD